MSASEKALEMEEGITSASKPKVRKVESDEEDSGFECYNKFDGKSLHVDIDKEVTKGEPTLAIILNRSLRKRNKQ